MNAGSFIACNFMRLQDFLMHEMPNLLQRGWRIASGFSEISGLFNNLVVRLFDMLFLQKPSEGNLQKWQVL